MQNNSFMKMFINQIISSNPQARQLYESLKGKNEAELKQYAENVANGKGVDLRQFLENYGIRL